MSRRYSIGAYRPEYTFSMIDEMEDNDMPAQAIDDDEDEHYLKIVVHGDRCCEIAAKIVDFLNGDE